MSEQKTFYVLGPIPVPMEDEITHTAENGYECEDPECICHWKRRTQCEEFDETGTHAPDCRCSWCEPQ